VFAIDRACAGCAVPLVTGPVAIIRHRHCVIGGRGHLHLGGSRGGERRWKRRSAPSRIGNAASETARTIVRSARHFGIVTYRRR